MSIVWEEGMIIGSGKDWDRDKLARLATRARSGYGHEYDPRVCIQGQKIRRAPIN